MIQMQDMSLSSVGRGGTFSVEGTVYRGGSRDSVDGGGRAQIWSNIFNDRWNQPGADPGFQVRGRTLKNRAERREARKNLGYFV